MELFVLSGPIYPRFLLYSEVEACSQLILYNIFRAATLNCIFQVGTKFDPKELVFRNYANVLGPQSRVELMYSLVAGQKFTLTIIWVDPGQEVAGYYNVMMTPDKVISVHKPELRRPLQPGVWTVKLYYKLDFVAQTKFIVLPFAYDSHGKLLLDVNAASRLNTGSQSYYTKRNLDYLKMDLVKQTLEPKRRLVGEKLLTYMDVLLEPFWRIRSLCYRSDHNHMSPCDSLLPCHVTEWSSRSPDLKSTLGSISGVNGGIR